MAGKHEKQAAKPALLAAVVVVVLLAGVGIGFFAGGGFSSSEEGGESAQTEQASQLATEQQGDGASDLNSMAVATDYGELLYPEQWGDYLLTSQDWDGENLQVSFSASINDVEIPMFRVTIGNCEDTLVGQLTDGSGTTRDVFMAVFEIEQNDELSSEEQQRVYAMQEDLNYLIDHLE